MNTTIIVAAIQQRLKSPVRMVLLGMAFVFPLLGAWFMPVLGLPGLANGFFFAVALSAGLIGQDVSTGVLQLVFARPVRRWEYVLSRWLAFSLMASVLVVLQVTIGSIFISIQGLPIEADAVLKHMATQVLAAIGGVSILTLLSSLIGGLGDLALWVMVTIIGGVFQIWGTATFNTALVRVSQEIGRVTRPELDITALMAPGGVSWFAIASYLSTVTLCLALAMVFVNRKELSYASG